MCVCGWQTDMFRGLLWLFNFLHKECEGELEEEKGVMQFSIFAQFPPLEKRSEDTHGLSFSVCVYVRCFHC